MSSSVHGFSEPFVDGVLLSTIMEENPNDPKAIKLLREWFKWWQTDDYAPIKMPDALHIKTLTFLVEYQNDKGGGD